MRIVQIRRWRHSVWSSERRATGARLLTPRSTNGMCWPLPRPCATTAGLRAIAGPLFLGIDTHALSPPACASALEVLAANGVDVMLATNDEPTPTPSISLAI